MSPLILSTVERRRATRDGARQPLCTSPLNRKEVARSSLRRKCPRWLLYRAPSGTPYAFLSPLRSIHWERSWRFHIVASRVEWGVAADRRRRLCVRVMMTTVMMMMMMMISGGMSRQRSTPLRGPVKKITRRGVVDWIWVRCWGKGLSLIYHDGLRCYWAGTPALTLGFPVLPSTVSTPLGMWGLQKSRVITIITNRWQEDLLGEVRSQSGSVYDQGSHGIRLAYRPSTGICFGCPFAGRRQSRSSPSCDDLVHIRREDDFSPVYPPY